MKNKELRIVNIFLLTLVIAVGLLTLSLSANSDILSIIKETLQPKNSNSTMLSRTKDERCTEKSALSVVPAEDPQLAKLSEYQDTCSSYVTNRLMFFTSFPRDKATAKELSSEVSTKLIAFKEAKVTPIVIIEPYINTGAMSYREYLNGQYDTAVDQFFTGLAANGITSDMMGTWVPFPESNTPSWNNKDTEPKDFSLVVNKYLGALKKQFPSAKGSILLSATTYEPSDTEYSNGDYISLVPYIQNIDKKLVTSIGIQGFPWVSRASSQRREIFRASEFLQTDRAIEAAQELRTRDIWFNTGSFGTKYTLSAKDKVEISPADRKAILDGILEELMKVRNYQQNEYRIFVNLFAENKAKKPEATDWSYLQDTNSTTILKGFIKQLNTAKIDLSLYDDSVRSQ